MHEIEEGHDDYATKAHGILTRMESFDMYFGFNLALLVFSSAEQFSTNLQAKDITIQEATNGATLLISHFNSLRTESKFNIWYEEVLENSSALCEGPKLHRKMPRRLMRVQVHIVIWFPRIDIGIPILKLWSLQLVR